MASRAPMQAVFAAALLLPALFAAGGCSSSRESGVSAPEPPAAVKTEPLPVSSDDVYDYRVANDGCNCLSYSITDAASKVEYRFQASYKMQTGVLTEIQFTIVNRSDDTLSFERSAVRVSSRNIRYQYNNKFLPLPWDPIPPRSSGLRKLTGKEVTDESNWHKIAGEQLVVTIKGLTLAGRELKSQAVTFLPENPNIGD